MSRWIPLAALLVLLAAPAAQAVEVFTNFHNGENIGFPPMEVPAAIYGGFGHGGWNPHAQGTPFRSINPVPSMMPTGQAPGRFGIGGPHGMCLPSEVSQPVQETQVEQSIYVSDRRHGRWQRSGSANSGNSSEESSNEASSNRSNEQPTIAPSKTDEALPSTMKNGPTKSILPKAQTPGPAAVVHPDAADEFSDSATLYGDVVESMAIESDSQSPDNIDRRLKSTAEKWSKASALFPSGDFN